MKLEKNKWYLIRSSYIQSRTGKLIVAAKYLNGDRFTKAWELSIPIDHPAKHDGGTFGESNTGRYGYCVYVNPEKIIKKLSKEEAFLEVI